VGCVWVYMEKVELRYWLERLLVQNLVHYSPKGACKSGQLFALHSANDV